MRNIKLVLEYDGSRFFGFQKQSRKQTVQGALEKAMSRLFDCEMKIKSASGRTDSGVHAAGQIVNFATASSLPASRILKGLNYYLPDAIAVREAVEVGKDFHARFSAQKKMYEYRVWNHAVRSPLMMKTAYQFPEKLNLAKMRAGARILKGTHDFSSFCAASRDGKNPAEKNKVRTLYRFVIKKEGALILFQVEANGFLYHMVRNLVGTLLEVGRGRMDLEGLQKLLKARDRRQAGATVPANGLTLVSVTY